MTDRKRFYAFVAVGVVFAAVLAGALATRPTPLEPAAQTVQAVLELRSKNATDVAAYARHIESTEVASALAADSAGRKQGEDAIPGWETPQVTNETSTTAEVTVKWRAAGSFKDWPESTIFAVELRNGRWVLVDAQVPQPDSSEATNTAPSGSNEPSGSSMP